MGSTSEQGLWSCQLDFLSEAGTAAYNYIHETDLANVPFWVDSICVPKQHDLRQKAIVLMAQSYEDATAVVVTDRMLLELSLEDSVEEQLFVLYISNWIQRMWTLPEALLSKHHLFRLRDGLVDIRSYFASEILAEHFQNPIGSKLLGWVAQFMAMPFLKSAGQPQPTSLNDVALHLAKRTSSRPKDEILAVAGTFGLDVREYLSLKANERMARFLQTYNGGKVPRDILFLDGPKLSLPCFSWAPKPFMS